MEGHEKESESPVYKRSFKKGRRSGQFKHNYIHRRRNHVVSRIDHHHPSSSGHHSSLVQEIHQGPSSSSIMASNPVNVAPSVPSYHEKKKEDQFKETENDLSSRMKSLLSSGLS